MIIFFETLGKHHNNNKHREKPNKRLLKGGGGDGISTLKTFMIFINRKTYINRKNRKRKLRDFLFKGIATQ